jgi:predicted ATPase
VRERVQSEAHSRLRYQCSPFHINSPLHPVIEQLERAAGISRDDTTETNLNKLEILLATSTAAVAAVATLFADLLSIPAEGRYPPSSLSPQQRKERTLDAWSSSSKRSR